MMKWMFFHTTSSTLDPIVGDVCTTCGGILVTSCHLGNKRRIERRHLVHEKLVEDGRLPSIVQPHDADLVLWKRQWSGQIRQICWYLYLQFYMFGHGGLLGSLK